MIAFAVLWLVVTGLIAQKTGNSSQVAFWVIGVVWVITAYFLGKVRKLALIVAFVALFIYIGLL